METKQFQIPGAGKLIRNLLYILIGALLSAIGINMAIHAGFGSATLAVLWQGVAGTLKITIGQASLIVSAIMLVFCFFYDKTQIFVGTILYQGLYSIFTDMVQPYVRFTAFPAANFGIMILGILLLGTGTAIYSYINWGRGPYEAVMFALVRRHTTWQIRYVRMIMDIGCVVFGVLLGGKFGICTICTALLCGQTIQFVLKIMNKIGKK